MVGGHCVDMPGYCAEIAPDIPADMRGYFVETAWPPVDIRRTPVRTLHDLPPYLLIRGWCLTKMTGFPIPESRLQFRSAERPKTFALMCRCRSTERAF
jgi:hypothetical protein